MTLDELNAKYGTPTASPGTAGSGASGAPKEDLAAYAKRMGFSNPEQYGAPANAQPQQSTSTDIASRFGTDLGNRVGEVKQTLSDAASGKINPLSTGIQVVGKGIAGPINDFLGEGIKSTLSSLPDFIKQPVHNAVNSFLQTDGGKAVVDAAKQGADAYNSFKQAHPEIAKDAESVLNIAALIPEGKAAETAVEGASAAADTAKAALKDVKLPSVPSFGQSSGTGDKLVEYLKPKLSLDETASQLAKGKGEAKGAGALARDVIAPTDKAAEASDLLRGTVDPSHLSPVKNINAALGKVSQISEESINPLLKDSAAKMSVEELQPALDKIEAPLTLQSPEAVTRITQRVKDVMTKALDAVSTVDPATGAKTFSPAGGLEARQAFDSAMKPIISRAADKETKTALEQFVLDSRRVLNEHIASSMNAERPGTGDTFLSHLRDQHVILDAVKNMSEKGASGVGKSAASLWLKKHPAVKWMAHFLPGSAATGAVIDAATHLTH